jgi:hypothetical protein
LEKLFMVSEPFDPRIRTHFKNTLYLCGFEKLVSVVLPVPHCYHSIAKHVTSGAPALIVKVQADVLRALAARAVLALSSLLDWL